MIWLSVARPHILAIVFMSTVTYGWIMGGAHTPTLLLVALSYGHAGETWCVRHRHRVP